MVRRHRHTFHTLSTGLWMKAESEAIGALGSSIRKDERTPYMTNRLCLRSRTEEGGASTTLVATSTIIFMGLRKRAKSGGFLNRCATGRARFAASTFIKRSPTCETTDTIGRRPRCSIFHPAESPPDPRVKCPCFSGNAGRAAARGAFFLFFCGSHAKGEKFARKSQRPHRRPPRHDQSWSRSDAVMLGCAEPPHAISASRPRSRPVVVFDHRDPTCVRRSKRPRSRSGL